MKVTLAFDNGTHFENLYVSQTDHSKNYLKILLPKYLLQYLAYFVVNIFIYDFKKF